MKRRFLTESETQTLLNLGKMVEIYLGKSLENEEIIYWISLQKNKQHKIQLLCYEVFDEGNVDYIDIYSFSPVDPDELYQAYEFETLPEAIECIKSLYCKTDLKFVNQGVIQDEYADNLKN